jgi:hypothetical protein
LNAAHHDPFVAITDIDGDRPRAKHDASANAEHRLGPIQKAERAVK